METENKKLDNSWYNNASIIINIIIGLISLIIILSQSFAINHNLSTNDIFRSLLNHNSVYLIMLVYFISLKTKFGKRNFNFLNLFLILLYTITTIASLLTIFQSFSLISLLSFSLHIILLVYMFHTLLLDTRIWKGAKLELSPFNDISNDGYFYSIIIISVILLMVNLIEASTFDSAILAMLDCLYYILISRYIYLYKSFLESKNIKGVK